MAQIDCNNHSNYEKYYIGWPKTVKTSFSLTAHIFKSRAGARDLEAPPNTTREALPPFPSPLPSPPLRSR